MKSYYNVDEVESAIANLASAYPSLCRSIGLPNATAEGRRCHAIKISTSAAPRDTLVLTGAMHGMEWGGCEILVGFAADLLAAQAGNAGLQYGNWLFANTAIQMLLSTIDIVVFPLVNPDGRAYSQAHNANEVAGWRKNRNRKSSGGDKAKIGVDIGRNFDFLWALDSMDADSDGASDDPAMYSFHGTRPFSEPEARNVKWLLDTFGRTRWLIDIHGCSSAVLYNWGDDANQSTDPTMNFRNPLWQGKRGLPGDTYSEFNPAADTAIAAGLAARMKNAIQAVRESRYSAGPSFSLYAVSGTLHDYAYSRHWEAPPKPKIRAFVVEYGRTFHPEWSEMEATVGDVCAGLFEFCVAVTEPSAVATIAAPHG